MNTIELIAQYLLKQPYKRENYIETEPIENVFTPVLRHSKDPIGIEARNIYIPNLKTFVTTQIQTSKSNHRTNTPENKNTPLE